MSAKKGIDVSYAQGNIDFSKIDKNEVSFVIIRSSYGWEQGQKDSRFERNIKGFQDIGIPCGAYHYSYAQNKDDAIKEARYCISCIKEHKLQLPVFYDLEDSSISRLGRRTCTDIAKTFCDYMKKEGWKAGIYLNPNWLENYVYKDELIGKYELWLAQWGSSKPSYECALWQYRVGPAGFVNGIISEVDLDYMYVDSDSVQPDNKDKESDSSNKEKFKVGDIVKVLDPIDYDTGKTFQVNDNAVYSVIEAVRDRIVIGVNNQITSAINAKYLKKTDKKTEPKKHTYTYIIRSGDTLTSISEKYHTTVKKIIEENNIENPNLIYSGHILRITV